MTSLAPLMAFAHTLADEAAGMLAAHVSSPLGTTMKADKTFVTTLDLAIETRLRERITAQFPDHGIWGEEFEVLRPDAEWVWTLDPIDGTMAFVAGMPVYSTLIALCRAGVPVIGVMNFPATGERWAGQAGTVTETDSGSTGMPADDAAVNGGGTSADASSNSSGSSDEGVAEDDSSCSMSPKQSGGAFAFSALVLGAAMLLRSKKKR